MTTEQCNVHENGVCAMHGKIEERRKQEAELIKRIPDILSFFNKVKGFTVFAAFIITGGFGFTLITLNIALNNHEQSQAAINAHRSTAAANLTELRATTDTELNQLRAYVDLKTNMALDKNAEVVDIVTELQYNLKAYLNDQPDFMYTEIKTRVNVQ